MKPCLVLSFFLTVFFTTFSFLPFLSIVQCGHVNRQQRRRPLSITGPTRLLLLGARQNDGKQYTDTNRHTHIDKGKKLENEEDAHEAYYGREYWERKKGAR